MRLWYLFGMCLIAASGNAQQRIIGGEEATIEEYPFSASMLYSPNNQYFEHQCGGTIITNNAILSAAHCFTSLPGNGSPPALYWRARVGSARWAVGGVVHRLRDVVIHPNYDNCTQDSDIAVLRTETRIRYNAQVARASIAGKYYTVADRSEVWAIGWGKTSLNSPVYSPVLRTTNLTKINQKECQEEVGGNVITDNVICIGRKNVTHSAGGQCNGDSGSPVIQYHQKQPVIVGVTSWAFNCTLGRYYGVMNAKVSSFSDWINETVVATNKV